MSDDGPFDVAVIGAGLLGAAIARECVVQGLHTVLIEAEDLAAGASAITWEIDPDEPTLPDFRDLVPFAVIPLAQLSVDGERPPGWSERLVGPRLQDRDPLRLDANAVDTARVTALLALDAITRGAALRLRQAVSGCVPRSRGVDVRFVDGTSLRAACVVDTAVEATLVEDESEPEVAELTWVRFDQQELTSALLVGDWCRILPSERETHVVLAGRPPENVRSVIEHLRVGELDPELILEVRRIAWRKAASRSFPNRYLRPPPSRLGATFRTALRAVEEVMEAIGGRALPMPRIPVLGGEGAPLPDEVAANRYALSEPTAGRLRRRFGNRMGEVMMSGGASLLCPCALVTESEARHVLCSEQVSDLASLLRRLDAGRLRCGGSLCVPRLQSLLTAELRVSVPVASPLPARTLAEHELRAYRTAFGPARTVEET